MHSRSCLVAALAALCAVGAAGPASAQVLASQPPPPGATSGWTFSITPYVWLPTFSAKLQATTPNGGSATTTIDAGIGDYISDINFVLPLAGEARYDRFSILTDILYLNASFTSSDSHVSSVDPGTGRIDISRSVERGTGTRLASTVWTAAGGYTLAQGEWGNIDAIVGLRLLAMSATTNYFFDRDITTRLGTIALSRSGSLEASDTFWNAIGGVRGRINIPDSRFYVPFYFDVGGGGLPLTWQAFSGLGYRTDWADLSVGYRYLAFENGGDKAVRNLDMGGVILLASFHF